MAANDNAMTRFLFAILQQKCLKDIDWNKVAHDPILAQEITNGHAARMRYSRFRSAMLGIEPTRRNRTNQNRNRVTKKKKDDAATSATNSTAHPKREPDEPETPAGRIKQEPNPSESPQTLRHETPMTMMAPSPRVKEEQLMFPILDQHQQQSSQQQSQMFNLADMQAARMQMRLLTPDSDVLQYTAQHTHSHSHSPVSVGNDVLLDAAAASPFDFESAHHSHNHHQHEWHHHQHHQSPYAAAGFGGVYGADGFSTAAGAAFGEPQDTSGHHHQLHQHHHHDNATGVHHHSHHGMVVPDALGLMLERHGMEGGDGQGMVKHEDWDHGAF
ncbi:hypothetical protein B0T18DRAFT_393437 [Schizothecium vesticola]|uniref:Myb-like DNA-binding domain-containing protein n=1 Tax=Schizothecium vesticola TaxID=314040 RepID=A0AA40EJX0_9PEZI|nr:hypothetical protein B0T18DRAFT_393437 [Schizothecium vesticola]